MSRLPTAGSEDTTHLRKEQQMARPYRARVDERAFLNLPGFHGSAVVNAYVEDTSDRDLRLVEGRRAHNFKPRVIVELSDCTQSVSYELSVHSDLALENSMFKLEVMIAALQSVANALPEEAFLYRERQKLVDLHNADLPDDEMAF
jgi:hypothetical protein